MKAIVAGGTGLVGSFLLTELQARESVTTIHAIARRAATSRGNLQWIMGGFESEEALLNIASGCDVAFCALGTTIKKAGSQEAFYKVDFQYVTNFAQAARKAGVKHFSVISAMGADRRSAIFYNRVKGEMESFLESLGFESLTIIRPGLLRGPRAEFRLGEKFGTLAMKCIDPILLGSAAKYRSIKAENVAKAMVADALGHTTGKRILTYREMMALVQLS